MSLEQLLNSWFALGGTAEIKLNIGRAGDSLVGHRRRPRAKKPKSAVAAKRITRTKGAV